MLEVRPIISCVIGYIIGIILGLYCKISIVFLYLIIYLINIVIKNKKVEKSKFKLVSFKRYSRYLKIIFTSKVLKIIIISSVISNSVTIFQNNKYQNLYVNFDNKEIIVEAVVISNVEEKQNKDVYKIKVKSVNNSKVYKNTYLILNINKKQKIDKLNYGQQIKLNGIFKEPTSKRNYKGFDYKEYLKTKNIYGTIEFKKVINKEEARNLPLKILNNITLSIKNRAQGLLNKEISSVLLGLTLGNTNDISKDVKQNFQDSNISHVLAISGLHVGYIMVFVGWILDKTIGKRKSKIGTSIILIFYVFLTGCLPSVVRAGVMGIIAILSGVFHRKNDTWNNIALSALVLLTYNPFLIESTSVLLSYAGTIGIILLYKNTKSVTISAMLFIMPIMVIYFNKVAISSLIISILVGFIIGPVIILCFIFIILSFFELGIIKCLYIKILEFVIRLVLEISKMGAKLPFCSTYLITPSILEIIIYYIIILIRKFFILSI